MRGFVPCPRCCGCCWLIAGMPIVPAGPLCIPPLGIPMLPGMLAEGGYRTAIAGKLHVLPEPKFDEVLKVDMRNAVAMAEGSAPRLTRA